jgi:hypothetical protein
VSDLESARINAGHSRQSTTQIYSRGDERRTAEVAVLRANKGKNNGWRTSVTNASKRTLEKSIAWLGLPITGR